MKKLSPTPSGKKPGRRERLFASGWKPSAISLLGCFAALAAAVALNLFVAALPVSTMQMDMTTTGIYSLSPDTLAQIDALSQDVDIYWICAKGSENSRTETILKRYDEAGSHIKVTAIDPAYYPNFVSAHSAEDSLTYNSLIVESSKRSQIVRYADYNTSTYFLLEDYLNSALRTVTAESRPVVYSLSGHGETELGVDMAQQINLNGYDLATLNLVTVGQVPDDARILLIMNPSGDISDSESQALTAYLADGGRLLVVTGFSATSQPNLDRVMESCGLRRVPGYVCESGSGSYYSSPTYLVPQVQENAATSSVTEGVAYVLAPVAHGIATLDSYRSSLNIYPLLSSSQYSYAKQDLLSMDTAYAVGDLDGPFDLGVAVTEDSSRGEMRTIWYSSSAMLDAEADKVVSGTNSMLFLNSLNWLAGSDVATLHAKATATGTLTVMPGTLALWSTVMLGLVPLCFLALGAVISLHRRRR